MDLLFDLLSLHHFHNTYISAGKGLVGINLRPQWMVPANENDPGDANAADGGNEFVLGLFGDPIFKGDYSETVKKRVGSFLPQFTQNEKRMLNGKFLVIQYSK